MNQNFESDIQSKLIFTLETMLDNLPLLVWFKGIDGNYINVNSHFELETGKTKAAILGRSDHEIFPKEEADIYVASDRNVIAGDTRGYFESEYKPGFFKEEYKKLIFDSEGNLIGTAGFALDITTKVRLDEALKESEVLYRSILNASPDDITILDLKGRILIASPRALTMFGYSREELIGSLITDYIVPEDRGRVSANTDRMFNGELLGPVEFQALRRDGSIFDIEANAEFIRGANGRPTKIVLIVRDISERKLAEEMLRLNQRQLKDIIEFLPDAMLAIDKDKRIIIWNKAIEKMTGIPASEMIGRGDYAYTIPFYGEARPQLMDLVFDDDEEIAAKYKNLKREGNTIIAEAFSPAMNNNKGAWTYLKASPLHDQAGNVNGVIEIIRDITERKQKEEEIEFLSYHDQLTGLYNRRFYEEELMRLDTERNFPISIAMGDVNGLKLVNDSFGHVVGDELLKKVAEVLKKGCRADDIIARLGGDEFVIILPRTSAVEAEKVISRIQELSLKEKSGAIDVSISFGYGTKTSEEESIQEIFKKTEDHMYRHKLFEHSSIRSKTMDLIMNTLYEKNNRELLHSKRVSEICEVIAAKMNLEKDEVSQIRIAGLMHDIGKIGIDEKILNKPDKLNHDERTEMERHPEIGWRILSSANEFSEIARFVLEHQERWDGKGYPRGLKGEDISIQARIIAIADAFDAMTSCRTYGMVLSEEAAVMEIKSFSGSQFDPAIAKVFIEKVLRKEWKHEHQ